MILKPISRLQAADIHDLVENQVREGRLLDYKRDLVGQKDGDKKEFLADISSFANSSGGHLLIGIAEAGGVATEVVGVVPENMDKEILRLENIIRDGLDPRVPTIALGPLDIGDGRHVIAIEIVQSLSAPHRVIFQDHGHFYGRNSAGKHRLDVDELRRAFTLSGTLVERIREFQAARLNILRDPQGPARLMVGGGIAVLHIVPVGALAGRHALDLSDPIAGRIAPLGARHSHSSRLNLDGRFTYLDGAQGNEAISQVFRSGCVELAIVFPEFGGDRVIPSTILEKAIIDGVSDTLAFYQRHEVGGPVFVFLSMLNVGPFRLAINPRFYQLGRGAIPLDRNDLIFPELQVDELAGDVQSDVIVRPLLDQIWQAWGHARSANYDEHGRWRAAG